MNRVTHLEKLDQELKQKMDILGIGIFDILFTQKAPRSMWLRRAMAIDLLLARARAAARETAEQRQAELAGIRILHRVSKLDCVRQERSLLLLKSQLEQPTSFSHHGGVN